MNTIERQIKLLLKNKSWQYPNSFEELGYIYFGPLLFNFFVWLMNEVKYSDKVLFNSREGFFLEKIYKIFQEKYTLPQSVYFKTSRKISSLASFKTERDIYDTFKLHRYHGTLSSLLRDRFGICPRIEQDYLIDTVNQIPNIDYYLEEILIKSNRIRNEYGEYVNDIVGASNNISMVDSGYQGTTQYYLEKTYQLRFKGRYITFKGNKSLHDVVGFYNFTTTNFQKNIIFFESVFTDSVGTYVDIKADSFINEEIDTSTHFFNKKQKIVLGIETFIREMLSHDLDIESTCPEYSDYIFNLMCTKDFVKNYELLDIFYHDNYYTRNITKKIVGN
jgi:hypothetical protein